MMEVAMGVAHPPGGLHHNNRNPLDDIRVKVDTVKPEFMQWMQLLRDWSYSKK
jgi:hypothetical protein